jgi:hypothetical protein
MRIAAIALAALVALSAHTCLADAIDSDNDSVPDSEDFCPNTPTTLRYPDYFEESTGCSQRQVDLDFDGVCNSRSLPIKNGKVMQTTLCAGADNCPFVYNPLQTDSFGDSRGDACDPGNLLGSCWHGADGCTTLSVPTSLAAALCVCTPVINICPLSPPVLVLSCG